MQLQLLPNLKQPKKKDYSEENTIRKKNSSKFQKSHLESVENKNLIKQKEKI